MKIALLGYGKMGKMIESIAKERGHDVVLIVDEFNRKDSTDEQLREADVAIEFSVPSVATSDYTWCFDNGVPVVSGTTGWLDKWDDVMEECKAKNGGFFYASNFSVGVNIFFQLNRYLAKMMSKFSDYRIETDETHHIHKLDAPSGTAITIAQGIIENHSSYNSWKLKEEDMIISNGELPITAYRRGEVPGNHGVKYLSPVDEIEIRHDAYSRQGFALGAVVAAEFMVGKKGIYSMDDLFANN